MPKAPKPAPSAEADSLDILLPDINGVPRGQRIFGAAARGVLKNGAPWPSSLYAMRFDGHIVEETGLGLRAGDPDFPCRLVPGTFAPTPWRRGGAQAVFEMRRENGEGFFADPREILRRVLRRLRDDGIHPVVAFELEFFLLKGEGDGGGGSERSGHLHALSEVSRNAKVLDLIRESAEAQKLPVFAAISEDAPGQFEVKLRHVADPFAACLHAILLRRAVRECARACKGDATFLAKPFANVTGSGMHLHISAAASPRGGKKIFADESVLRSAVAGALSTAREGTAFFAPFANSYRRFVPGSYAPINLTWANENRSVTVRVPRAEKDSERRLEFRLSGADANPFLVLAAVLSGIHRGVSRKLRPPAEAKGDATARKPGVPLEWRAALDALARGKILPSYMGADFIRHYLTVKENEWRDCQAHISDYDRSRYQAAL